MHKRFCTSSPDGRTFRITLRIHQAAASAAAAIASQAQVNDPTKGFLIVSEVDKQRASEQAKLSAVRDHTQARTHGSQQERHADSGFIASI
jgi:hypothetical protein